jgi:hypothetical protein
MSRKQPALSERLVRIARSIEAGEIYYNASKLAWATEFSEDVHSSNEAGLLGGQALLEEMSAVAEHLRLSGAAPDVVDAWNISIATMRAGGFLSLAEVPETRVCRACGHIYLGQAPTRCETCGASRLTFREFPVPWWPEALSPAEVLDALRSAPGEIGEAIDGMSDQLMAEKPSLDEWSIRDVLAHLLHSDGVVRGRVVLMLTNEDPGLENITVGQQAKGPEAPASALFERYEESRAETVSILAPLTADGWLRYGHHPGIGTKTVLHQASYFTKHERLHVPHIEKIRRSLEARTGT